jgi:hypothetical protein
LNAIRTAAVAVAIAAIAAPALAAPYAAGGVTPKEAAAALKAEGLPAEIVKDGDTTSIKSSSNGINWRIYLYGCKDERCSSIQFSAGFDLDNGLSLEKANEWNYTKRFARAALDEDMDPYVRYDIDTESGFNTEAMALSIQTWQLIAPTFAAFIGYGE